MNELQQSKQPKPILKSLSSAGSDLRSVIDITNSNISAQTGIPTPAAPVKTVQRTEIAKGEVIALPAVPKSAPSRIFYTGRFKAGKDFVAAKTGAKIFSLAEPLYYLQEYFFGKQDKDALGAREFLQRIGQYGRGEISANYPITVERLAVIDTIRKLGGEMPVNLRVAWGYFGFDVDIWMNAMLLRVSDYAKDGPASRVAVTNVRFENEHSRLTKELWTGYHVICSPRTWTERLKSVGLSPDSPEAKDTSELLAAGIDISVSRELSKNPRGPKLRAIWSDENVACPSPRIYTIPEYLKLFVA